MKKKDLTKQDIQLLEATKARHEAIIEDYQKRTGHSRPVTRREFLAAGVIQMTGFMVLPSVLGMMAKVNPAYAAQCASGAASNLAPFVNINLEGGWSLVNNWIPRDIGGQLLPSYDQIGQGTVPATTTAFANNALFAQTSATAGFLNGVRSAATADTLAKTVFVGVPVNSNDDSGNNEYDIGGLLKRANLAGEKLPNMGQRDTPSGVNQRSAYNMLPNPPLRVQNFNDIAGALGFTGTLAALNQPQQVSLAKLVSNLSNTQARGLASLSGGQNIENLVECATGKNLENIQAGAGNIDPRLNATLTGANIWNLANNGELARAGMVMNAVNGLAGAVGLEMGGYDYHGNPRATTDQRDRDAGRLVGQVLQTAAVLGKPVFIYLTSDGSVVFNQGAQANTTAAGDSGNRGCAGFIAFHPTAAPASKGSQIGGFTNSQTVNTQFVTGANAQMTAAAAFANWAKFSGDTSLISKVIPSAFSSEQLNQVLVIG